MAAEEKEEEKLRKMAEVRAILEKRIEQLETELEGFKATLEFVNETLLKRGFKKAESAKPSVIMPKTAQPEMASEETVSLKTAEGEFLANLYIGKDSIRVILAEDKNFNVNTPPFMQFLIERVLTKMQERDRESAKTGGITADQIIAYNIMREGDVFREITIRNVEPERIKELKSSIRWTLEKMYEKMTQAG